MEGSQHTIKPLTVYKASAGSGKTFTLASEYIKLLINNPHSFENILAVTFTNKATNEMKERILSQLYGIAHNLPESESYAQKIRCDLNISDDSIRQKADEALHLLLHNYNFFRVQTIDTFFQGVLRNLAKELSLSNNMRVSLNDKQIIGMAVDNLMDTLNENPKLMTWIMEFINESMDEDKSWNITKSIKDFGENVSKEFYKSHRHQMEPIFANEAFFDSYKDELTRIKSDIIAKYKNMTNEFFALTEKNNLLITDFFQQGKGIYGYFQKLHKGDWRDPEKLINKYMRKAMESPSGWYKKGSPHSSLIEQLAQEKFLPLIAKIESTRTKDANTYLSVVKTLSNISKLRLLNSIEKEIIQQNGEHSRFMLSDTQTLLNNMIGDSTGIAPFIFEKIGSRIKHIMIDEFQDTSSVQWKNFKVLLNECMGEPEFSEDEEYNISNNLIVGDVKQSIYRFRSGDWRLLNGIDKEFNANMLNTTSLTTNFRSERNIIQFNNEFFKTAISIEAETAGTMKNEWKNDLLKAYADIEQKIPTGKEQTGFVNITLFEGSKAKSNDKILNYISDSVKELVDNGAMLSDIAILVRTNKQIPEIAKYFSENNIPYPLVSEEAFRLDSSPALQMMISAMKLVSDFNDSEAKASLAKYYQNTVNYCGTEQKTDNHILANPQSINGFLPEFITDDNCREQLRCLSLTELAEYLLRELSISELKGQTTYVSTFFDQQSLFIEENGAVLSDFLKYWEEELGSKTVAVDSVQGIRIMSLHHSKGLEFDHVIIPFCDWMITPPKAQTLWCEVNIEPFNRIPFIPVQYKGKKSLECTIYENDGYEETMQEIVDNLNLLYVGFTRAKKNLYVVGGHSDEKYRSALIAKTLREIHENFEDSQFEDSGDKGDVTFTFGSLCIRNKNEEKSDNVFLKKPEKLDITAHSFKNDAVKFQQSNQSMAFAEDATDEEDKRRFIRNGTILHQIFSTINTLDDVEYALRQLEFEGLLYNEGTDPDSLRDELKQKFNNPVISNWFSPQWKVFNECNILYLDENGQTCSKRPDRVITNGSETIVIDYKFGKESPEYEKQVKLYMQQMTKLNMPGVKGVIWYVNLDKIHEVIS